MRATAFVEIKIDGYHPDNHAQFAQAVEQWNHKVCLGAAYTSTANLLMVIPSDGEPNDRAVVAEVEHV